VSAVAGIADTIPASNTTHTVDVGMMEVRDAEEIAEANGVPVEVVEEGIEAMAAMDADDD
jgi:hypothetical protein